MTDTTTPTDLDEAAERARLTDVIELLEIEAERIDAAISKSASTIDASKRHIWDNQRDMDHAEKASVRTEVGVAVTVADGTVQARRRISRLLHSPYFGRVDFQAEPEPDATPYYIGLHSFRDRDSLEILIHDWRAPVSSLYYDYESGEAEYATPDGIVRGEVTGKRQYKITGGELDYMIESTVNIGDEVLQRELSQSTDEKMKNIVATIQREQNAVIRNETADVLILQGVAGSGKTSIALHRVAFLLYRFKDTLSSDNVMILSPNKVFGDYISNVLPELGEQQVKEIDFDAIARLFLSKVTGYETFSEQVSGLLEGNGGAATGITGGGKSASGKATVGKSAADDAVADRMRFKARTELVAELDDWIESCVRERLVSASIKQRGITLSEDWVTDRLASLQSLPIFTRLERLGDAAVQHAKRQGAMRSSTGARWTASDTTSVRKQVRAMFPYKDAWPSRRRGRVPTCWG